MKKWLVVALVIGALLVLSTKKSKASPAVAAVVEKFRPLAETWGNAFGLSTELILSEICVESGGNPQAVSGVGALGLMQVMPTTLNDINQMLGTSYEPADLYQPAVAIQCGAAYLHWLIGYFQGNLGLAVRAYNQGVGNVANDNTRGQDYVDKVNSFFQFYTGGGLT